MELLSVSATPGHACRRLTNPSPSSTKQSKVWHLIVDNGILRRPFHSSEERVEFPGQLTSCTFSDVTSRICHCRLVGQCPRFHVHDRLPMVTTERRTQTEGVLG